MRWRLRLVLLPAPLPLCPLPLLLLVATAERRPNSSVMVTLHGKGLAWAGETPLRQLRTDGRLLPPSYFPFSILLLLLFGLLCRSTLTGPEGSATQAVCIVPLACRILTMGAMRKLE